MATLTVTNLNDSGAGSLRQAILDANSGDTINFDPGLAGGTLVLTNGELDITKSITIDGGTNADSTPAITIDANGQSRVFDVASGLSGSPITATLDSLVMVNGYVASVNGGGIAIGNYDAVTLSNSRLAGNVAHYTAGPGGGSGGAISVGESSLTLLNTAIDHNSAQNDGGGLYDAQGSVNVVNSTLYDNSAGVGGGVYNRLGTLTTVNAILSGNSASGDGGAIENFLATANLYDSTLTGNLSNDVGAIDNEGGSLTLSNSIVAGNYGPRRGDIAGDFGTRIYFRGNNIVGSPPAVTFGASIDTSHGTYTQIDGTNSAALQTVFALVGKDPNTGVLSGVLADNSGLVQTIAINPAGIAYNAGSNGALPPNLSIDARGFPRVVGGIVDIGAFEQQQGATYFVTTLADNPYDGKTLAQELAEGNGLSLRQALGLANASGGPSTIIFAPDLAGGTIYLANGELDISSNVTIDGNVGGYGTPGIAIDAGGNSRVFDVGGLFVAATLDGLVIRGGSSGSAGPVDNGGGIAVGQQDSLTLKNSKVTNNQGYSGGGIYAPFGSSIVLIDTSVFANSSDHGGGGIFSEGGLRLINTTISNNYSASEGGGIDLGLLGSLLLTNGTLAGNSSGGNGGGIYGAVGNGFSLYNSTLTGNYAAGAGGGIYTVGNGGVGGAVLLFNSIVAGNGAYGSGTDLDLDNSPLVLHGNNILGSTPANVATFGSYTQIDGTSQVALETVFARVAHNPFTGVLSGVLADNGGPVKTVAINPAGVAHDAGSSTALPPDTFDLNNNGNTTEPLPVDARGFARVAGGTVDVGAFEQQPGATFVVTTLADETYDGGTLAQETADGTGLSLREALGLANQDPTSVDTITFAPNLIGGSTHGVNDGVLLLTNGALTVTGNVTIEGDINGDGTPDITIDGQGASRDLVITGGNVNLDGLTITGGYAYVHGGGVSLGQGAYGPANVAISHSVIANNQSVYGGGISVDSGDALSLSNSVIAGNYAFLVGGGIANQGALSMRDTTVSGNTSGYIGGGVANSYVGTLAVVNSTISNNQITSSVAGPLYDSAGAGLYNAGNAALINTTIANNKGAYAGGGIYNSGNLQLTNVTIANNSATNGGGLYSAACGCGNATLNDSTLTGNYASQFGGGIYNANGTVTLTNTIVAGNRAGYQGSDVQNGAGITSYAGVNLFSQAGVGGPADIVQSDLTQVFAQLTTVDPDGIPNSGDEFQAGTLADNGGSVQTVAIKVRGSAQNAGSTVDLPPDIFDLNNNGDTSESLPVDARGEPRVFGAEVDIGAVEAQAPVAAYDFNGDGKSDLLFQNTNGTPQIWLMNGTSVVSETSLVAPPPQWKIVEAGDFNDDGKADILWLNTANNTPSVWEMNGTSIISAADLPAPPASWHIAGVADVFGSGDAAVIWQNSDGTPAIWQINGTSLVSGVALPNPGAAWKIVATGDFNGDGKADLLWHNTVSGQPAIWEMNGASIVSAVGLTAQPANMEIIGTGDFNGDGDADILWLNTSTNAPTIWTMNGTSVAGMTTLPAPPPSWRLVGTSDVNGDGKADILWQNADGTTTAWTMNGTTIAAGTAVGNPGVPWVLNNNDPPLPSAAQPGMTGVGAPTLANGGPTVAGTLHVGSG
jgi:fibronectin-binding autotransporter adhesin